MKTAREVLDEARRRREVDRVLRAEALEEARRREERAEEEERVRKRDEMIEKLFRSVPEDVGGRAGPQNPTMPRIVSVTPGVRYRWQAANGQIRYLDEMDAGHLAAALAMIRKKDPRSVYVAAIEAELRRRGTSPAEAADLDDAARRWWVAESFLTPRDWFNLAPLERERFRERVRAIRAARRPTKLSEVYAFPAGEDNLLVCAGCGSEVFWKTGHEAPLAHVDPKTDDWCGFSFDKDPLA